jgi:DNA polymerase (family 10)
MADVPQLLRQIATALDLAGENRFRAQAYRRGADALEAVEDELPRLAREGRLADLPGIGKTLAAQVGEILATGRSAYLDTIAATLPAGALALAAVPDLSLPMITKLSAAGITSGEELRAATTDGRLLGRKGFGAKTVESLAKKLARGDQPRGGTRLVEALDLVEAMVAYLEKSPSVEHAEPAGEVRRGLEVVQQLELVARSAAPEAALDRFAAYPRFVRVEERTETTARARLADGLAATLHVASPVAYAACLQRVTGSDEHNALVDAAADAAGLRIAEDGVFRAGKRVAVPDEDALYARLGLAYVAPPLREEGEPLRPNGQERRLLQAKDVRGMVHCHSTYSDGKASIEEMARAAEALGMEYLTVTDHSPTASYANGVEIDRLKRQWEEIDRVQEKVKIRLLRGTESDIVKDGALDYPDAILERFDVIIGSIHNRYRLDAKAMTARVLRAVRHPLFKIWGHALGRILESRPPIEVDLEAILDAVAESRCAIELNGDPYRMDLPPLLAKGARARGIRFVVSVDAHSTRDYDSLAFGVLMAQRAGLGPDDVLNTLPAEAFAAAVRPLGHAR